MCRSVTVFLTMACSLSATPVILSFLDSATVVDRVIRVGDIAQVKGAGRESRLLADLENCVAGDAAPAGFCRYVTAEDLVRYVIRPRFPELRINIAGACRSRVRTDAVECSIIEYENMILDYLHKNIEWPSGSYSIRMMEPNRSWRCLRRPFRVLVEGLDTPFPRGNFRISLQVRQDNSKFSVPVSCKATVKASVAVAARTVQRGEAIHAADMLVREHDITTYRYDPVTDPGTIVGQRAIRTISPGTILHRGMIEIPPAVVKGDIVAIMVSSGRLRLSVSARARGNGRIGDRIWVENLASHKLVRAVVTARGVVNIAQGDAI